MDCSRRKKGLPETLHFFHEAIHSPMLKKRVVMSFGFFGGFVGYVGCAGWCWLVVLVVEITGCSGRQAVR
jgi:hypothetical protein